MWDAIVIGSGFGGAVTACRFAQAGMKVLLLERGRRWTKETYPRLVEDAWWWNHDAPERRSNGNGWIDLRVFPRIAVAQGAGVGGGSLIYANISCDAPVAAFDGGWPEGFTHAAMRPYWQRVAELMNVQTVPAAQWPARTHLMREAAAAIGAADRFRPLELAVSFAPDLDLKSIDPKDPLRQSQPFTNRHGVQQGTCVHCGECDIGCRVHAKNTLDLNYIALAERAGCEVRPDHLVSTITPRPAGSGYRVDFQRLDSGASGHEEAAKVVLAAGSLGSTELLLRCRDQYRTLPSLSRRLGAGWCSNGDFLTPAFHAGTRVEPSKGPTITSAIDFLDGSREGKRFWIEDGGFPDLLKVWATRFLESRQRGAVAKLLQSYLRDVLGRSQPFPTVMPWFAQGMDQTDGKMHLRRRFWLFGGHKLRLDWDIDRSKPLIDAIVRTHELLSAATGGKPMVPPTWSLARYLVTPHPLGGCNMGDSADLGVVDRNGEVFGHPGLFVIDGAMVPRAVGVNPSRTIAALAELACEGITGRVPV